MSPVRSLPLVGMMLSIGAMAATYSNMVAPSAHNRPLPQSGFPGTPSRSRGLSSRARRRGVKARRKN